MEKTIRHVRTVKTRISLCNLIRVFFLYLLDSYILFCGKGTFSSGLYEPALFEFMPQDTFSVQYNCKPTIKFVKTKRIQFVEIQTFYKNFTTTSILLHFNMSFEFDYFLHIHHSCIHFGLRYRKQNAKGPES